MEWNSSNSNSSSSNNFSWKQKFQLQQLVCCKPHFQELNWNSHFLRQLLYSSDCSSWSWKTTVAAAAAATAAAAAAAAAAATTRVQLEAEDLAAAAGISDSSRSLNRNPLFQLPAREHRLQTVAPPTTDQGLHIICVDRRCLSQLDGSATAAGATTMMKTTTPTTIAKAKSSVRVW